MYAASRLQPVAVLLLLLGSVAAPAAALSVAQVTTIATQIETFINSTARTNANGGTQLPMLPAFVRLAFHDCVGSASGCDGCVNLAVPSNKGLKPAVDGLEALYNNAALGIKATGISRADFWALAGMVAANYGTRLQPPPPPPPPPGPGQPPPPPPPGPYIPNSLKPALSFKTGRVDCATAPVGAELDSSFPDGLRNGADTTAWFAKQFGFSAAEATAILGAHTLGRANFNNSGFNGPWVPRDNSLDNGYFRDMSNAALGWAQGKALGRADGKIQFQHTGPLPPGAPPGSPPPVFIMLNADMGLLKQFTVNSTGGASCTFATCAASATAATVTSYANNNTRWLDAFGAVFAKMQNVCGRTTTGTTTTTVTIKPCTLSALTGAAAARSAAVQARVTRAAAGAHVTAAVQEAAAAVAAAEAANAAVPFSEPNTVRPDGDGGKRRRAAAMRRRLE